jgi:hypothetical protein
MHIHIQNDPDGIAQHITQADWEAAGITGYQVTIGNSQAAFAEQAPSMEILITSPWKLETLDLFSAPHLTSSSPRMWRRRTRTRTMR